MPSRRKHPRKPADEQTYLAIRVAQCDANVDACVNHAVYKPPNAWDLNDEEQLNRASRLPEHRSIPRDATARHMS